MNRSVFILMILVFIISCNHKIEYTKGYQKMQDTEIGEVICLKREDTTFYRYLGDSSVHLQNGTVIQYHCNASIDTVYVWEESVVIKSHVNGMISDCNFILIDQIPLDSVFGNIAFKESYPHRPYKPTKYNEAMQKLIESKIHQYWIISKQTDDIYGPLSKEEFLIKREELGVPKELSLKEE